ncbi:hypothetical protein FRC09_018927 [Ceratobasidium sp. 395]|nr:hypothetical protein FRC09_018927 [Ceratobasidium sp. 395]
MTFMDPSGDDVNEDATLNVLESFEVIADMRDHEGAERALFNVPLQFEDGSSIAVKANGLVVDQKKGSYPFYANMVKSIAKRPRRGPLMPMRNKKPKHQRHQLYSAISSVVVLRSLAKMKMLWAEWSYEQERDDGYEWDDKPVWD